MNVPSCLVQVILMLLPMYIEIFDQLVTVS